MCDEWIIIHKSWSEFYRSMYEQIENEFIAV